MSDNYVQEGKILQHVAATDLTAGTPVVIGVLVGIPITDIASGATGSVSVSDVWALPLKSGDTPAQGVKMYWHVANGEITTLATGATLAGVCATALTGDVLLNVAT
ncbi:MAG: DUF2190 family protein [Ketobacter sp.]|nr:DUF2190 family protein [Ketobacter sp.]